MPESIGVGSRALPYDLLYTFDFTVVVMMIIKAYECYLVDVTVVISPF